MASPAVLIKCRRRRQLVGALPSPSPLPSSTETDLYKVALEEERRLLDRQRGNLDNIRARTLQFLAFIGASTAFLAGSSLNADTGKTPLFMTGAILGSVTWVAMMLAAYAVVTARPLRRDS